MKLYELCGVDSDVRFSPFVWRVIMGLHHKGLSFERIPLTFLQGKEVLKTNPQTVPTLVDGDTTVVDSFAITEYLDTTYPEPSLFGGQVTALQGVEITTWKDLEVWTNRTLCFGLFPMVVKDIHDCLDPENQVYFRQTREKMLGGHTLEDVQAGRDKALPAFQSSLEPLRVKLKETAFLSGDAPGWFDYCVFGVFQWGRIVSDFELLAQDDIMREWREHMLDLYGGLGRAAKLAY